MARPDRLLRSLHRLSLLNDLDLHLAEYLLTEAKEAASPSLALAVALTSRATGEGHVCLDLNQVAGRVLFDEGEIQVQAPGLEAWRDGLLASGIIGRPGDWQPLILDQRNRLYLHRYWAYEQRLGNALLQRAEGPDRQIDPEAGKEALARLFPADNRGAIDWQKLAVATASLRPLTIISGGPGTGKTTTVLRLLALLRQQAGGEALRIALAAPTGMAAARLQQAIQQAKASLSLSTEQLASIPEQASTLHRLLGMNRSGTGFRHHRDNPLLLDVVIVDEASMVDLALMAKLLDALPHSARLVLLGDRDQLASVEAGSVMGDLCAGCNGPDAEFARQLSLITQQAVAAGEGTGSGLKNSVVELKHSYRFDPQSPLGQLARAVNRGDTHQARKLLDGGGEELGRLDAAGDLAKLVANRFARLFEAVRAGAPVASLFTLLYEFRLLCVLREGPTGVHAMNNAITRELIRQGQISNHSEWYPGRPVMLSRNDYQLNLYNGETGIVLPHPEVKNELAVAFQGSGDEIRWVSPSRLPYCETVFAVTVHKSQGSEFQEVVLQLPDQRSPILCRELIYTAVTRSKKRFTLIGEDALFDAAITHSMRRSSGLADLLSGNPE
ncbi:MAG: exodeoxyribonuclease V subunit alpha [Candidatus Thiodiazotropha sp. (ex Ctena orbiculata)]|uniref:RecBCD enzyme subunit RecD n=1 Tax=Candidatus Thiodiazotropha taylori TaxID=2792791 RepID=A0A944QVH3_9GAMM|nr:exodeoxyribonuclease V subunit alpha [Candidatus Thiodiazotropha taylori]MBT2989416.1 exodeoxyribonuclease V subunit alpha [Candidatus Thiodiazotropha taylori]MBT2996996.1 exodeoxyribonuclease V subunit alpha [Candidatus Thiodiazotropha taylori]MBT3000851.1 exodeoxyribonuclease V subunit alpha [Candidatus Thiodiazotropha taylori]MBV2108214.1 exodeoxyribonuclease V subunit alpha [Candidatus Thiodiazotropha taylori]